VRAALDEDGFERVRIVASGGFTVEKIEAFERRGVPVDAYGSALAHPRRERLHRGHRDDRREADAQGRPLLPAELAARARRMRRSAGLVFETHSLTVDNERGIATGWLGGTLSLRGRELAADSARAGGRTASRPSMPLISRAPSRRWRSRSRLGDSDRARLAPAEIDYGELNGAPVAVLERERAFGSTGRSRAASYRDAVERVADFLEGVRPTSGSSSSAIQRRAGRSTICSTGRSSRASPRGRSTGAGLGIHARPTEIRPAGAPA
jgi:alpha-ribazole phosphatase/probable phosphoglycerate mutase